jgi:hypothetical protein
MGTFTLSDLGVFLGVVGGIVTSMLLTIQESEAEPILVLTRREASQA